MVESCPICGNKTTGKINRSLISNGTRTILKKGGAKATMAGIGTMFGGPLGTVSGLAVGTAVDMIAGKHINKAVDGVTDVVLEDHEYEFVCPNCGHTWTSADNESNDFSSEDEDELRFSVDKVKKENGYTVVEGMLLGGAVYPDYDVDVVKGNGERIRATIAKIATKEFDGLLSVVKHFAGETARYKYEYTSYLSRDDDDWYNAVLFLRGIDKNDIAKGDEIVESVFDSNESVELSSAEQKYLNELNEISEDGKISVRERRLLEKIRIQLGISEQRAEELENNLFSPSLTPEEQEYFDEYKDIKNEGEISLRDQRFLDKLKKANGISDKRAKEIESLI